jgi:hypothetical protein
MIKLRYLNFKCMPETNYMRTITIGLEMFSAIPNLNDNERPCQPPANLNLYQIPGCDGNNGNEWPP